MAHGGKHFVGRSRPHPERIQGPGTERQLGFHRNWADIHKINEELHQDEEAYFGHAEISGVQAIDSLLGDWTDYMKAEFPIPAPQVSKEEALEEVQPGKGEHAGKQQPHRGPRDTTPEAQVKTMKMGYDKHKKKGQAKHKKKGKYSPRHGHLARAHPGARQHFLSNIRKQEVLLGEAVH